MICVFNVDRFYAQLGAFSIFVISHERWVKPGSNWIACSVNLMLTDFGPNWAFFFFFFSLFSVKKSKKRQGMCHLDDTVVFLYPAGAARVLYLTRFFFLSFFLSSSSSSSSSGNTSKAYISVMSWSISTRLGHKNPWPCPNLSYNQLGVKGHVGVTGVKKVISLKTLLLLQITGYGHVTHVHASAWPLLQKLWV